MSETETRLCTNPVESETRLKPLKTGLKMGLRTNICLEYYNTAQYKCSVFEGLCVYGSPSSPL